MQKIIPVKSRLSSKISSYMLKTIVHLPMKSFLNENNLKGKTLIPFNTNAGYGLGSSLKTIRKLSPNSTILDEFSVKGGVERDGILFVMEGKREIEVRQAVQKWLEQIKVLKD